MGQFSTTMRVHVVFFALVAMLAVTVVTSKEATAEEDLKAMSREQLVSALETSRSDAEASKKDAKDARDKITTLQDELDAVTDDTEYEHNRQANEKDTKLKQKKKATMKKNKKIQKETKFSDAMMEHAAEYLSMKVAEKTADKGSKIQKAVVLESARQAGRAGAVEVLKKVLRSAAVAAVKTARKAAKKAGTKGKHAIRKISVQAAKDAVNKLLKEQDVLVEKTAQKFYKLALKKFPPSVFLAEDDDKPNVFVAPPSIHLGFGTPEPEAEVVELKTASKKKKTAPKKNTKAAGAKKTAKKTAPKKTAPKKTAKKTAPKKAAAAKKAVDTSAIVPETTH